MVELRCETDFVAKNTDFQDLADRILQVAKAGKPADVETLKAAELDGKSVETAVQELSAKIGEKLELAKVVVLDGPTAIYLHRRSADLPPAVGVLVEYNGDNADAARAAAMQVAAMKAKYVTRDEVPADLVANERRIAEETAREEGKPAQALPKIVEGRVNGFFKDIVLLDQPSVTESKKTVKAVLDEAGISVTRFARFEVGQA
jgi:elongation factor Ts